MREFLNKNKNIILITILSLFAFMIAYIYRKNIYEFILMLKDQERLKTYLNSFGAFSGVIFFLFQVMQVVIFFIPGEVIQAAGGYAFGTWLGTLISIGGITVGSMILFVVSKRYGRPLVDKLVSKNHFEKLDKILNSKKINLIVFLLYLIPGIPKDSLIFVCGVSKINLKNFTIYSTLGRIPALIVTSYFGAKVADGNHFIAIIISIIALIAVLVGIIKREYLFRKLSEI